ncbi:MAG TPA: hypothetical protein VN040_03410 [Pseudosphingobacterium sp.]|nr:hypothetical protein [Pseudosphingobacterium sp.]
MEVETLLLVMTRKAKEEIAADADPEIAEQTTIKLSSVGSDSGLLAAASLIIENSQFE